MAENTVESNGAGRTISSRELRQLIEEQGEVGFQLVDVRERNEYEVRHLPGALHIPLGEIAARAGEINPDLHTVFYCARGKRSALAVSMLKGLKDPNKLFSLEGGIEAWDGNTLPGFPRMSPFNTEGSLEQIVLRAMDLEKGAERLYGALKEAFQGSVVSDTLQRLFDAEEGHAKLLFDLLPTDSGVGARPFAEVYAELKGNILENGESFDKAVERIKSVQPGKRHLLLELGVDMEYQAYDLYRNLAASIPNPAVKSALLELATQETQHFRLALSALGQAVAESRRISG